MRKSGEASTRQISASRTCALPTMGCGSSSAKAVAPGPASEAPPADRPLDRGGTTRVALGAPLRALLDELQLTAYATRFEETGWDDIGALEHLRAIAF